MKLVKKIVEKVICAVALSLKVALSETDYELLEKSLLNDGQKEAIILINDEIVDGIHRYEILKKHGIEPIYKELGEGADPLTEIVARNRCRRNMSNYDKALFALYLENLFKEQAKENQKLAGKLYGKGTKHWSEKAIAFKGGALKRACKEVGISASSVKSLKKILKNMKMPLDPSSRQTKHPNFLSTLVGL